MNKESTMKIPFDSNNKLNGIFYFYNYIIKQTLFEVYSSSHKENIKPIQTTFRNNSDDFYWCSQNNDPNITFYFQEPIHLTDYVIRNAPKCSYTSEFMVYGSNNNDTWTELDHQYAEFCSSSVCLSYSDKEFISNSNDNNYYHYFKFMNLQNSNSESNNYILFSAIELFGEIRKKQLCSNQYSSYCYINTFILFHMTS